MPNTSSPPVFDLIIPVFNEAESIPRFFYRLNALHLNCRIIAVDNGSTDDSLALLKSYPYVHVIEHEHNEGYGASIIDGIQAGTNDLIVIIDADGEYPPECIPQLLALLHQHPIVYTSRFLDSTSLKLARLGWAKIKGNQCISFLFSYLFNQNVTDLYTGCKAMRRSCLTDIELKQQGFEHVLELSVKLAAKNLPIHELGVQFTPRQAGQSKMNHITEGVKYFYWLLRYAYQYRAGKL